MNKANILISDVDKVIKEILKEYEEYRQLIAKYDLAQQDILHYIENHDLENDEVLSVHKLLKSIRVSRRDSKNNFEAVHLLKTNLVDIAKWGKLKNTVERMLADQKIRSYKYKVIKYFGYGSIKNLNEEVDSSIQQKNAS